MQSLRSLTFKQFLRHCRENDKNVDELETRIRGLLSDLYTPSEINGLTYTTIMALMKASQPSKQTHITVEQRMLQLSREGWTVFKGAELSQS